MDYMSMWRLCLLLEIARRMAAYGGLLSTECNEPSRLFSDLELLYNCVHILRHTFNDSLRKDPMSQQEGLCTRVHAPREHLL
jgi:hypothetical protein